MADSRLNSVHLDPARRQDYRRILAGLLHSCGQQTFYAERRHEEQGSASAIANAGTSPVNLDYWLADQEFIYPLAVGVNTLGRSSDNDVVVADLHASRRHCAILVHAGRGCELHDTASRNGTYLNGTRLTGPTALESGDEIRVCDRRFIFLARPGPPSDPTILG